MTTIMPFLWLAAFILSAAARLHGGHGASIFAYPSAAGLLAAAAPLPARIQLAAFTTVLIVVAVVTAAKKAFIKNS